MLSKICSVVISGLVISTLTTISYASKASACTGFWGSLDPTCDHGGPFNPGHLITLDFKICNETRNTVIFNINGLIQKPLRKGYCRTYTNYPEPGLITFDASFASGVQQMSYNLSNEREYYFDLNNREEGIDLYRR